jgi:hypothetical protein
MPIVRRIETLSWVIALGSALVVGCGSKSTPADSSSTGGSDDNGGSGNSSAGKSNTGDAGDSATQSGDCPTGSFNLLFSPVYSAYDGGAHDYQVPVYAPTVPDPSALTWSASDPSMVKIEKDADTGGILITTKSDGVVKIIAKDNAGACGVTTLTITKATADDWKAGSDRYHSGTLINRLPRGGYQGPGAGGAGGSGGSTGTDAQCTSCHGSDATSGPYQTVEHTPYQTGGFSDDDLLNIIQKGIVPTTGSCAPAKGQTGPSTSCFDPTVVAYATWQGFHKWSIGDSPEALVIYLRSLTPVLDQTGTQNLGGFNPNGGAGGRGGGRGGAGGAGGRGGGRGGAGGTTGTTGGSTNGTAGTTSVAGAPSAGASSGSGGTGGDSGGAPSGGTGGA